MYEGGVVVRGTPVGGGEGGEMEREGVAASASCVLSPACSAYDLALGLEGAPCL